MNSTPEIALIVAALALIGVLVTALVAAGNSRKRGDIDKRLVALKAEHDRLNAIDLADVQANHSKRLKAIEHDHALALVGLQHKHSIEINEMEKRLQEQMSAERMRQILNEANWKRVLEQIRLLKSVGLDMVGLFKDMALNGHELIDQKLFPDVATALKLHTEFKTYLREVRSEIRTEDYRRLSDLHKYLVEVFLDLARTQPERLLKKDAMAKHVKKIELEEHYIEVMAAHFLRPTMPALPLPSQKDG